MTTDTELREYRVSLYSEADEQWLPWVVMGAADVDTLIAQYGAGRIHVQTRTVSQWGER